MTWRNPPLVTVITPSFNRARWLEATAESILRQTYPSIEYIVVDDGSTDDTRDVVGRLRAREGHIVRYVRQDSGGEASAVNRGWAMARGEYVAIVSSDDPQPTDWLETCVRHMEEHRGAMVGYPDWRVIDDSGAPIRDVVTAEYDQQMMVGEARCLPGPGALIRRSAADGRKLRRAGLQYYSDFDCWLRLSLRGDFVRIPTCAANWRQHDESLSAQDVSRARSREAMQMVRDFFARNDLPEHLRRHRRRALGHMNYQCARMLWRRAPARAAFHLMRSLAILGPMGEFRWSHSFGVLRRAIGAPR